jgi:TfoX/Sxy family transcriptional regulator of competence genes
MKWRKAPPALVERFHEVFPGSPAETRPMFGYPAGFLNGNMFMGLWQDSMVLRLGDEARKKFLALEDTRPFEPMGRPMREYVVVSPALIADDKGLRAWIAKSLAFAETLPPKKKSKKTAKKK